MNVRVGTAVYSLWKSVTRAKGHTYTRYEFLDPTTSRRVKRASEAAARAELKRRVELRGGGGVELDGMEGQAYAAAREALRGTGLSMEQAAGFVRELYNAGMAAGAAFEGLREEVIGAVRTHFARCKGSRKTIREVVDELVAARTADGVSAGHLADLRLRLGRLAKEVHCSLGQLSAVVLDDWLRGLPDVSVRTRLNYRSAVSNLIGYAKSRKYLPAGFDELAGVTTPRVAQAEVKVFSAEEFRWLLAGASENLRRLLLIGGFAGLRQSEVLALKWSAVDWEGNHIVVPAQTKTGRRLAPMPPNLRAWLEPRRAEGRIVGLSATAVSKAIVRAVSKANGLLEEERSELRVEWVRNGARHTFVSARCAVMRDLAAVAEECGHSVGMLKRNYRKVLTPAQGKEWFELWPDRQPGVLQMSLFAAGKGGSASPQLIPNQVRQG